MAKKSSDKKPNAQQRLFISYYVKHMNATRAAKEAGYSEKNADKIGPALLGNSRVKAAIEAELAAKRARNEINADWFVRRLVKVIDFDPATLIEEGGDGKPYLNYKRKMRELDSLSISEGDSEFGSSRSLSLRKADKLKAMEMLMKLMGVSGGSGAQDDDLKAIDERVREAVERRQGPS